MKLFSVLAALFAATAISGSAAAAGLLPMGVPVGGFKVPTLSTGVFDLNPLEFCPVDRSVVHSLTCTIHDDLVHLGNKSKQLPTITVTASDSCAGMVKITVGSKASNYSLTTSYRGATSMKIEHIDCVGTITVSNLNNDRNISVDNCLGTAEGIWKHY